MFVLNEFYVCIFIILSKSATNNYKTGSNHLVSCIVKNRYQFQNKTCISILDQNRAKHLQINRAKAVHMNTDAGLINAYHL